MLVALKMLFEKPRLEDEGHRLRIAAAALLVEMMRMDDVIAPSERQAAVEALRTEFGLTAEETAELLSEAERAARDATDYYHFTSLLNDHLTPVEKGHLIENLWRVAYADGSLDKYEEHLLRKIADLLYVPRDTIVAARRRAAGEA